MRTSTAVLALVVLVALAITLFVGVRERGALHGASTGAASPTSNLEAGLESNVDATQADDADVQRKALSATHSDTPEAIDRDVHLHGVVLAPDGEPLAGARVEVSRNESQEYHFLDRALNRAREPVADDVTDAQGHFAFAVSLGRPYDLEVAAHKTCGASYRCGQRGSNYLGPRHLSLTGSLSSCRRDRRVPSARGRRQPGSIRLPTRFRVGCRVRDDDRRSSHEPRPGRE